MEKASILNPFSKGSSRNLFACCRFDRIPFIRSIDTMIQCAVNCDVRVRKNWDCIKNFFQVSKIIFEYKNFVLCFLSLLFCSFTRYLTFWKNWDKIYATQHILYSRDAWFCEILYELKFLIRNIFYRFFSSPLIKNIAKTWLRFSRYTNLSYFK